MSETPAPQILKTDLFGQIRKEFVSAADGSSDCVIVRDVGHARYWIRPLARLLAAREAKVLKHLPENVALPSLISWDNTHLYRSYVEGLPLQKVKPTGPEFFSSARKLLHQLHLANVVHNDTAKEPNWLVLPDGSAGLIDFQLATLHKSRSKFFRTLAIEDVRHLLKHKRSYRPSFLTQREQGILNKPAIHSRIWRKTGKQLYLFITRKIFKWQDREGANDRNL